MKDLKNVPSIRFSGFNEPWEQRKFKEMYRKVSEKNDMRYNTDKIISVANMYYKTNVYISNESYLKTYNVFKLGDIAFEGNKSKSYSFGRFVENHIGDGIISHVFEVFRPVVPFDLYYWKYLINNELIMRNILRKCTKSSTMMTTLVGTDFLQQNLLVPCITEQKKIGKVLESIDNLITLHQRK